jgi:acetyl-CoA acyltransferase
MAARFELSVDGRHGRERGRRSGASRATSRTRSRCESHEKAAAAWPGGAFDAELVPVPDPAEEGRAALVCEGRVCARRRVTRASLAKLPPVFRKGGSVTAGNSSPLNDGAAALLARVGRRREGRPHAPRARGRHRRPRACDPNVMGEGPIPAVKTPGGARGDPRCRRRPGRAQRGVRGAGASPAFAASSWTPTRVNVRGGAIALGHPIGCSGARIAGTLIHAMKARGARVGVASLCIGVGQGIATLFESA